MQEKITNILLVEDEETHAELVRRSFEPHAAKFRLKVAATLEQARNYLKECIPDLIITDLLLPDGNGIDLLQKETESYSLPLVVMTAYGDEQVAVEAMKNGALDYVVKSEVTLADMPHIAKRALREWSYMTERMEAQDALREGEARYKGVFENTKNGVAVYKVKNDGEDFFFVDFNRAGEKIEKVRREELIGKSVVEVFPGVKAFGLFEVLQRVWKTGKAEHHPIALYKDKRISGWRDNFVYKLPSGEIVSVYSDETRPMQAEEALRESEERLRTILDSINAGILVIDTDTHEIVDANPIAAQMIGISREHLIGEKCHKYICPEEKGKCPIIDLGQKLDESERILLKENGKEVPVLKTVSRTVLGSRSYLIESFIDITDRKKLQAQLQQAQKLESLGTLAGGVAHDFNNILGSIIGYAELAEENVPEGSPAQYDLTQVINASNRAKALVDQILAFCRKGETELEPLQISLIVKEALRLLRAWLPSTIEFREHIESDTEIVECDPTQIHQVLMNLCTNAAQAMGERGGILDVSLTNVDLNEVAEALQMNTENGSYLRLTVSDNGPGMTPEILERIFDPYFTTKSKGDGTGLGLALVHGIVKGHGGGITVESGPGKGASFHVYLPSNEGAKETEEKDTVELISRGLEHILFIDDEQDLVNISKRMLEGIGYKVVTRTSGMEALELFRSRPNMFDLVITDQTMPKMKGSTLAGELMRIRPDIPIILCTGFSELMTEEKARSMGIRAFVRKPISKGELEETIRQVFDEAR